MEKELKVIEEREIIMTEEDIDKNNPVYFENNENENNKKREFYVYKHIRLDNNTCFYIGKGKGNRKDYPKRNADHDSICNRHGYKVVTIKKGLNEAEAFKLEADMINCYVSKMGYGICIKGYMNKENKKNKKFLTNCTWGGEGTSGAHHTEETKEKISEKLKGENNPMYGKQLSEEHKQKLSESHKGKHPSDETRIKMSNSEKGNSSHKGHHHSDETRSMLSKLNKGKPISEEHKHKISASLIGKKGHPQSEESRRKNSEAHKGKTSWIKGKHHTEEARRKNSEAHKGIQRDEETKHKISEKMKGKQSNTKGKHWKLIDGKRFYYE